MVLPPLCKEKAKAGAPSLLRPVSIALNDVGAQRVDQGLHLLGLNVLGWPLWRGPVYHGRIAKAVWRDFWDLVFFFLHK